MWRGESNRSNASQMQKWETLFSLHFFFLFYGFLFFLLLEKKKMARRKRLKRKGRNNRRPKTKAKSEKAEWKLEGKLPPFSTFFSSLWFFLFLCLKTRRCQKKVFEIEGQKREPKVRGQNMNLKENSFPSLHFFSSPWFFSSSFVWE